MTILQDWVELSTPAANGAARPPPGAHQDRAVDRHAPDPTLFPDDLCSRQEGGTVHGAFPPVTATVELRAVPELPPVPASCSFTCARLPLRRSSMRRISASTWAGD